MSHEEIMRDIQSPQENKRLDLVNVVRCKDCKYAEVADPEDSQDGYTCQFHRGSIWFSGSYCSWAERRQDADSSGNMSGTQKALKCTETHSCENKRTATHDWIPVTERLPKRKPDEFEYPAVAVTLEDGEVTVACYYESTKEWGCGEYYDQDCRPVAWLPLPEPYAERRQDG